MSEDKQKIYPKTPEPTLRRLPWYLAFLKILRTEDNIVVSSTQIANAIGIDASQVAKDLSYVDISGKTRVGYELAQLVDVLESFLGFNTRHKAIIFGTGSLGKALILDSGLSKYGLEVVAGFDVRQDLIGTAINGITIYHPSQCANLRNKLKAEIGILTVPADKSQEVTDLMINSGIKAIWNFTPCRVKVPENVVLQDTSLFSHLAVIFNSLNQNDI
ncbi:MAG: redox-sensing transcriptional repressor Rex [Bacteroidales bacterium]